MHADVVPSPTQVVHGVLWSITDEQLASLDIREGYPSYYDRKMLDIECAYISGGKCKAWTYFMTPGQQEFPPGDHYWNMLMSGYTYFNVPTAQMFKAVNRCKHLDYHANEHQYYKKRREIVNSYRNVA